MKRITKTKLFDVSKRIEEASKKPDPVPTNIPIPPKPRAVITSSIPKENEVVTSQVLNNSLEKYKTIANEEFLDYKGNIDSLQSMISEYLTDFIVIGHTVLGQRVFFRTAKTAKEMDALIELFKKTFVKTMSEESTNF